MQREDGDLGGVICFAGEDWWYHNRGHYDMQVMRRFARRTKVLFINSVVMQRPRLSDGAVLMRKIVRKLKSIKRGVRRIEKNFYVYSPLSVPLHHLGWGRAANHFLLRLQVGAVARHLRMRRPVVWVECPAAFHAADRLQKSLLVYQRTDCHEEFRAEEGGYVDASIREYDQLLRRKSDLVVYVSKAIFEQERRSGGRVFLSDHGVDFDRFSTAHLDDDIPADISGIRRPIAGFFGAIDDHTFDIELMTRVAELMPSVSFVLVGHSTSDVTRLATLPNVHMLGQKPYVEIPRYGKCFDVAIMPWLQNRWIDACNPVKLKEYLALGKPVVSTWFQQLNQYSGFAEVAAGADDFCEAIMRALQSDSDAATLRRRERVENCTWDRIAADLWDQLVLAASGV